MKGLPNLHRRGLLKLSGGGLLAGVMGGSPAKVPPMLAPLSGGADAPQPAGTAQREGWRLMDSWNRFKAPNASQYKTRSGSIDLDPDIACLRSVSPCMKAFMQRERDLAIDEQMSIVAKFFGADHY